MDQLLKLNLGCGETRFQGFVNADKYGTPDVKVDLEVFPWPWDDNSVEFIRMNHVLEHLGQHIDVFLGIIKELYRVSAPGSKIEIAVPHPRHDDFLNDPTHVRAVTLECMGLFSQKSNRECIAMGAFNSPLGIYHNVDFEVIDAVLNLDPQWTKRMADEKLSNDQIMEAARAQNNVIKEIRMVLLVVKNEAV